MKLDDPRQAVHEPELGWLIPSRIPVMVTFLLGVLLIIVLTAYTHLGQTTQHNSISHTRILVKTRTEAITGHLFLEEGLQDGNSETLETAWAHLDSADSSVALLLDGGEFSGSPVPPLADDSCRELAINIQAQLTELRQLAERRAELGSQAVAGTDTDDVFDVLFNDLEAECAKLVADLRSATDASTRQFKLTQLVLMGLILVITGACLWLFVAFNRRIEGDVLTIATAGEELNTANEELNATVAELQATNEFLESLNEELATTNEELADTNDELRQTQASLQASESKFRSVATNAQAIVFAIDQDGIFTLSEGLGLAALGLQPGQVVGLNAQEFYQDYPTIVASIQSALEGTLTRDEVSIGEAIFDVFYSPVTNQQGETTGLIGMALDISQRVNTLKALRTSESKMQSIFRAAPVGIGLVVNRVIVQANEQICQMVGRPALELIGQSARILYPNDEEFEWVGREKYEQINAHGTGTVETHWQRSDGSLIDVVLSSTPLNGDDLSAGVTFTALDITQRNRSAAEVTRLRNMLQNIVDSMPSMLITVDRLGRITQWNREAAAQAGIAAEQIWGQPLTAIVPMVTNAQELISQAIGTGLPQEQRRIAAEINGSSGVFNVTVFPLLAEINSGAVVRIDNVTEQVKLEELMIQSEKMLSVGGLAAGMAHEINNPLAGILQNAQLLARRLKPDSPANQDAAAACGISLAALRDYTRARDIDSLIEAVVDSGRRAAQVVDNMLSFSRKSGYDFASVDMIQLVEQTIELAGKDYNLEKKYDFRRIEIVREFNPGLPEVPCEKTKIQQVLLNLLRNSTEAMATDGFNGPAPRITLRLARDPDNIRIEVEDNGAGMTEATRRRVFEPFFTTKAVGAGTGLGLSVAYFIINDNHHGTMAVESAPGAGTRFIIQLPLTRSTT